MEYPETISFYRRKLPHWTVKGRSYFLTIRLKNSIPKQKLEELKIKTRKLREEPPDANGGNNYFLENYISHLDSILDNSKNDLFLKDPKVAKLAIDSLLWMEENYKWKMIAVVIMPNHAHILTSGESAIKPFNSAFSNFKGFTAREANKLLSRNGAFWSPETFDHWCRNPFEEERIKKYIIDNPVKAGLAEKYSDWPWMIIK
jgi:REP element-mobilizing transposase RayT